MGRSLTNAQQRHQEALSAIATVRLAVGAQTTGAPAVPAHATLIESLHHAIETSLGTCEVEDRIKLEMRAYAEGHLVGMLSHMATMASGTASMRPAGMPLPAQPTPTTADTTTSVAQVPPARPAAAPTEGSAEGDSRIQPRVSTKEGDRLPAQAHASPSHEAKTTCAEVRRASLRKDAIESARALEAFELQEKEDAEDLTRLQEATDKAAESGVDS